MASQWYFELMPVERAKEIRRLSEAAIKAQQAGGLRSEDPKVRAATAGFPLNAETMYDRLTARRRLQSVVHDYERLELSVFKRVLAEGRTQTEAATAARQASAPLRLQLDKEMRARTKLLDQVCAGNARRKAAALQQAAETRAANAQRRKAEQ